MHDDRGMVTVETAIALFAFMTVLALCLGTVSAAIDQLRCTDAAREAARLTARGDHPGAETAARHIAPHGATIHITTTGEEIHVSVRATPLSGLLPGLHLQADAYALTEPTPLPANPPPADPRPTSPPTDPLPGPSPSGSGPPGSAQPEASPTRASTRADPIGPSPPDPNPPAWTHWGSSPLDSNPLGRAHPR